MIFSKRVVNISRAYDYAISFCYGHLKQSMVRLMRNTRLKRGAWRHGRPGFPTPTLLLLALVLSMASRLPTSRHGEVPWKIDQSHVVSNIELDARQKYRLWLLLPSIPNQNITTAGSSPDVLLGADKALAGSFYLPPPTHPAFNASPPSRPYPHHTMSVGPYLLAIPVEIIEYILTLLAADGEPYAIAALATTCRLLYKMVYESSDSHLWREIFLTTFDDPRPARRIAYGRVYTMPFDP